MCPSNAYKQLISSSEIIDNELSLAIETTQPRSRAPTLNGTSMKAVTDWLWVANFARRFPFLVWKEEIIKIGICVYVYM